MGMENLHCHNQCVNSPRRILLLGREKNVPTIPHLLFVRRSWRKWRLQLQSNKSKSCCMAPNSLTLYWFGRNSQNSLPSKLPRNQRYCHRCAHLSEPRPFGFSYFLSFHAEKSLEEKSARSFLFSQTLNAQTPLGRDWYQLALRQWQRLTISHDTDNFS